MYRRDLLRVAAFVPVTAFVACQSAPTTPAQVVSDLRLLTSGLTAAIASIRQIPGVPAPAMTELENTLTKLRADAGIVATSAQAPAQSTVQEIEQLVQAVASIALPLLPVGSPIVATIQAAIAILPPILAAAGISGTGGAPMFTPAQARLILAAAH